MDDCLPKKTPDPFPLASRLGFLVALTLTASGCARLNTASKPSSQLPRARLAPDAVVLDVAFVRLRTTDLETYESIWAAADEMRLSAELRRDLATNGIRAGVFGQQLPVQLQELLSAPPKLLENISEGSVGELEIGGSQQHLPVRAGHRSIIKASQVFPSLPVLLSEDGVVRGHQLTDARCILSLKPYPQGDGRVKLSLTPEIEHGELKTRWGGGEGMMIQQTSQERLALDRLRLETLLTPGQSLVLSTTPDIKGLGEYFFSQQIGGSIERRLLLIRFTQTQFDDLFVPEKTSAPLTTPGE
jgi:hypothetical protein